LINLSRKGYAIAYVLVKAIGTAIPQPRGNVSAAIGDRNETIHSKIFAKLFPIRI